MFNNNYDKIREELIEMRDNDLAKQEVLGRKFDKFERKFDKIFEIVSFQMLNDVNDKFYGTWLSNSSRIKCYVIKTPLAHQVSNNRVSLLINPLLFINHTIEDIKLYMKHEVIHLVSEHYKRVNELSNSYPRILPLLASDLIANHTLSKEAELPECFWTANTLKKIFNIEYRITDSMTVESITSELNEIAKENELFKKFIDSNSGAKIEEFLNSLNASIAEQAGGSGSISELGSGSGSDQVQFDEDMLASLINSIMQNNLSDNLLIGDMLKHITIDAATQSRGKFPGGLAGLIKAAMEPPVITWEEQMRRFIGSIAAGKKQTIFRRNRRQPNRVDLKGELRDKEVDLVVAIDTSGSMDDKTIGKCMSEIFEIVKLMKAEITIIECDSRIHKVYKAKSTGEVQTECLGRGGTSFSPVFQWLLDNKKSDSVLIYMSDGYGESQLDCKVKQQGTLWLMTER